MKHILFLLAIAIAGCRNQSKNDELQRSEKSALVNSFNAEESYPTQTATVSVERKLIRNGDLSFETSDVTKTKAEIESICKELNAYISNESQNNFEDRIQYNQTIRVPAEKFDALIQKLEPGAVKIESKNINTMDVTEEFIDVEARLATKKELEARYRQILKEAKTVADIVTIEGQIATVRSEIESMEGRLQYLKNQVSLSTLNVSYFERLGTNFGFTGKIAEALRQGWDNLLAFLIGVVNLWPFILIITGIVLGVARWKKRKGV